MDRVPVYNPFVPSSARIWDYLRDGKDYYEPDQKIADGMLAIAPDSRTVAMLVRVFQCRAVRLAAEAGVRQFIDLGTGLPALATVHEVACEIEPAARVVYIDNDPMVRAHCDALVAHQRSRTVMQADIRCPRQIVEQLDAQGLIDFREPVAVTMVGVLDHVMDEEDPAGIVAVFGNAMAPGSYLALAHGSTETDAEFIHQTQVDTLATPAQLCYRFPAEIEKFMAGFDLLPPGIAPIQAFIDNVNDLETQWVFSGGIGRSGHPASQTTMSANSGASQWISELIDQPELSTPRLRAQRDEGGYRRW
ncbi:SAM-dependent methyltransferase [Nocardia brasiliensis]|uniref:SAM-dependent methyltransferase n=1 Tax=Nocardia brasiliensis TaxID=37326 RepID=A0A6G9Y0L2_NOCBR|nr:SAM-dependent methyltransferase [Nocardia brasiliensis]QIS06739.1 SAM-dependent methyltransferase [Nocardia brasiliensis]